MSAGIIDGKATAVELRAEVPREVAELPTAPGLATILRRPCTSPTSARSAPRSASAGLDRHLPADMAQDELTAVLNELAGDPQVVGVLLQLPVPALLDTNLLFTRIPPEKNVDGLTECSTGWLTLGKLAYAGAHRPA